MIGPMLFSPMKAALKFLIERIESIFVDSKMIELDLSDHKSELIKVVVFAFLEWRRNLDRYDRMSPPRDMIFMTSQFINRSIKTSLDDSIRYSNDLSREYRLKYRFSSSIRQCKNVSK